MGESQEQMPTWPGRLGSLLTGDALAKWKDLSRTRTTLQNRYHQTKMATNREALVKHVAAGRKFLEDMGINPSAGLFENKVAVAKHLQRLRAMRAFGILLRRSLVKPRCSRKTWQKHSLQLRATILLQWMHLHRHRFWGFSQAGRRDCQAARGEG